MFPLRNFRGFTLIELLISILIVAILALLLSQGAASMTRKAAASTCAGNLRQLAAGFHLYAADHDGTLPIGTDARPNGNGGSWVKEIGSYVGADKAKAGALDETGKLFICPAAVAKNRARGTYFGNRGLLPALTDDNESAIPVRLSEIRKPSLTVLLYEGANANSVAPADTWGQFVGASGFGPGRLLHGPKPPASPRDATVGDAMNVLYADGHVQFFVLSRKPDNDEYLAFPGGTANLLGPGTTTKP